MSENTWRSRLTELLTRETGERNVVVIGLGHPLKGDDYVGSLIAKDLRKRIRKRPGIVIVDAEDSPENVLKVLNEEKPQLVVLIDSVEAGLEPGSVTLMDLSDTTYPYFGSHSMPLKVLFEMSPEILKTVLLGVQPSSYEIGGPLSTEVAHAEAEIVMELGSIFEKMKS
jgi:hydrogenase 3 maturation protease